MIELRSLLEPENCLKQPIPSNMHELEYELLACLRLSSAECPITLIVDGIDRYVQPKPLQS